MTASNVSMAGKQVIREASHAGSWYTSSKSQLGSQLDSWLAAVNPPVHGIGPQSEGQSVDQLPVLGARMIIAPHAGYSYSGSAAAWAYKAWDVSKAKRIFLLGPSHHFYLPKAALSKCTAYATPLGPLPIDRATTGTLHATGHFDWMSPSVDEDEHSLEMHLPYIHRRLAAHFSTADFPPLVPIMVGNTSAAMEKTLAEALAPHLADPETAWVVSSDFAHWGSRFRYTYYEPASGPPTKLSASSRTQPPKDPPIHESIRAVDFRCMGACEGGKHDEWLDVLEATGNTVCGRHPIGVVMAAVEVLEREGKLGKGEGMGRFKFVRYERSSEVQNVSESSVSYCSAYAVL